MTVMAAVDLGAQSGRVAVGRFDGEKLEMDVVQQSVLPKNVRPAANKVLPKGVGEKVAGKDKRVGKVVATFHITPKQHQQRKGRKVRRVI